MIISIDLSISLNLDDNGEINQFNRHQGSIKCCSRAVLKFNLAYSYANRTQLGAKMRGGSGAIH